jgi:hypothetical protein
MTIDDSARKLKSYRKKREIEVAMQSAKERVQFLQKYPNWDKIKTILRPVDKEVIEAVHGLNGLIIPFQQLAEQRNVSRQAVFDAHKKALQRLEKIQANLAQL